MGTNTGTGTAQGSSSSSRPPAPSVSWDSLVVPEGPSGGERTVLELVQGYQLSQATYVAAKLGVADVLAGGPLTVEEIAADVDARAPELRRVLRALVAAGVFTELPDGRFCVNEAARALQAGAPGRLQDVTISFGEEMYRSFGELLNTVRTGQTAFEHVFGKPLFDYYADHPTVEACGSARMLARTLPVATELARSDLMPHRGTLVDLGGGVGTLAAELLKRRPALRAVLFERRPVLELARVHLRQQGVDDRAELLEGDFFTSVPQGGDVYLLKSVLHDWDDARAATILRNCRRAMAASARLQVVEFTLPERMTPSAEGLTVALLDLIMLAYAGGRERTLTEFAALLDRAGLQLQSVNALASGPLVLEAVPARH